jgi:glycosyltransferase involved in cell wall biosynthesis
LNSAVFVVDAFVGIYETNIEDWKKYSPKSLRARLFGFQDYLAYRLADYLLIDNAFRASQLVQSHPAVSPSTIIDLPVGAPQWCASVAPTPVSGEIMQVLFYGNFLPLHGASTLIEALKLLPSDVKVSLTLIGGGDRRSDVMARAGELGVAKSCAFVSPVPETELACYIGRSHVVAGVFGSSAKARSVIPNKVWQGLASGRTVVTRQSPALTELDNFTGSQLVSVAPEDPAALAQALTAVYRSGDYMRYFGETYASLERYVESRFDALRRLDVRDSSGR